MSVTLVIGKAVKREGDWRFKSKLRDLLMDRFRVNSSVKYHITGAHLDFLYGVMAMLADTDPDKKQLLTLIEFLDEGGKIEAWLA
jgi:hypothetical protein